MKKRTKTTGRTKNRTPLVDNRVMFTFVVTALALFVAFSFLFTTSSSSFSSQTSLLTGAAVSAIRGTGSSGITIQANQANCSGLTTAGPYILTQNVNSVGTCFTIQSSNILIDCQGYLVNYSTGGLVAGYGVVGTDYDNITIRNCRFEEGNATVNAKYAIYFTGDNSPVENITIWNNTFLTRGTTSFGIRFRGVSFTNISSNTFDTYGDQGYGIQFRTFFSSLSAHHRMVGNSMTLRVRPIGIDVADTNNVTITENRINSSGADVPPIELSSVTNITATSNVINTTGSTAPGIRLSTVQDSVFESNKITTTGATSPAIYLLTGTIHNNLFLNNNLSALRSLEIQDDSSTDGTTINYLKYNNSFGEIAWMNNGSGTFLDDLDIEGEIGLGINLFIGDNVAGLNTSNFTSSRINSSVNITLKGLTLNLVNQIRKVHSFNTSSVDVSLNGFDCNATGACSILSYTGGTVIFNSTGFSSFTAMEVSTCGILNSSTTLLNSVSSTGTCFTINTSHILLNCAGYLINYSTSGTFGHGINITGPNNVTIKNCVIREASVNTTGKHGINLLNGGNITLWNNTIQTVAGSSSAVAATGTQTMNISNNVAYTNGSSAHVISIDSSDNATIFGNLFNATNDNANAYGINLVDTGNNTIAFNVIKSNSTSIYISGKSNNNISYNNLTSSGNPGAGTLSLISVNSNKIHFNQINSTGASVYGVYTNPSSHTLFGENIIRTKETTSDNNAYFFRASDNNTITRDNIAASVSSNQIRLQDSNVTMINMSFNKYNISFDDATSGTLTVQWNLYVNVSNNTGSALTNANVTAFNISSLVEQSEQTGSDGTITFTLTEFRQTSSGKTFSSPHTINTTNSTYIANSTTLNISNSNSTFQNIVLSFDIAPPRFDPFPENQTIEANTTFSYDFNGSDEVSIVTFGINDTAFTINSTGGLVNASPLQFRTYFLNITINDTSNNKNSTPFQITIQDTIQPRFDPFPTNQTIEANTSFSYDFNATDLVSLVTFGVNDTTFTINSTGGITNTTTLQFRTYVLNITINDTSNNKNFTYFQVAIQDTIQPRFDPYPTNQTIDANTTFSYDFNGTDLVSIVTFGVNDSAFTINSTGGLVNSSPLQFRTYYLNITINDTSNNKNYTNFQLVIQDTTPPRFDPFPTNQTIEANTSFTYDINATDLVTVVTFGVNDTAFNINSTGGLVNLSALQFSTYILNITINDTFNNKNSTFFQIVVQDTTPPKFDTLPTNQTIEYGDSFSYDINGSDLVSLVTFGINDSAFNINSTGGIINTSPFTNIGTYRFNLTINDTSNNKNATFFQIVVQDTIIPRFEANPVNQTIEANTSFTYDINATDALFANYSINYTSLFSINSSGAIINSSPILALGTYHFNISINDTSNNRNSTFFSVTVQDTMPPRFDPLPTNQTLEVNTSFAYDIEGIDAVSLVTYGINSSAFNINSTGGIINSTAILALGTYRFNLTINDTNNNKNSTFFQVVVQDTTPPRFDPLPTNQTIAYGTNFEYDFNATDNIAFFNYSINYTTLFAINDTGGLRSIAVLEAGTYVINISINDTFNNRNSTFFSVTMQAAPSPSGGSSGGGGGGGSSTSKKPVEIVAPECGDDTACAPKGFCSQQKCIAYECVENSDCGAEKYCVKNKCYKIFDIKLLQADSPVLAGDSLDFVYFLKGMADISGDVVIQFWLEKQGKKVSSGADTIYIGTYEEKTEQAALFLPSNLKEGEYTLYIELNYKEYIVESYRTIEIQKQPELVGQVVFANLPATLSSLLKEYAVVLATNKDVPVPAMVMHQIMKGEDIIWSKQEELMIDHSHIIKNALPSLEKGVYYFTTTAIIGGKSYTAEQMVTVDAVMEGATQPATGKVKKAFAGQAIGDATQILSDYSVLWVMGLIMGGMLLFMYWQRKKAVTRLTMAEPPIEKTSRPLTELERWMRTMLASGASHEIIIRAACEQGSWLERECTLAFGRALAVYNLKNVYGDFVTEEKLQELRAFIERSLEQGMSEERIIAHLVEAEWNSKFISEYVRAYAAKS